MAPIKFEKDLKEKIEQRELQPSANAWNRLQERLDENEIKKNKKGFWWFTIAASFVGILIVSSLFFNKDIKNTIEPTIVDVEKTKEPKRNDRTIILDKIEKDLVVESDKIEKMSLKDNKTPLKKTSELKIQIQQKQKALIKNTTKEVIAQVENEMPDNIKENESKAEVILSFEDIKLQEVVAQVKALEKENISVSDAEINALLDQAQKEIILHKLYNESTKKVDANALLQDVEAELEQSFRERAFKAIKSGYKYVKTAVAERNN